jgi:UDP-N-acetylglucosamine 2-epimerase (non-hydrolysing)
MKKFVLLIIGTRPEAIKMAPVFDYLSKNTANIELKVLASGQHDQLLQDGLVGFNLRIDFNLELRNEKNNVSSYFANLMTSLTSILNSKKPDLVLVHGDTTTAAAAALAAHFCQIPVGHVEAGLRSHRLDAPWPEEANRRVIDSISTLLFAPTQSAADQITMDKDSLVIVTGNTVLDSLKETLGRLDDDPELGKMLRLKYAYLERDYILVTQHRRESFGEKHMRILETINRIATVKNKVIFPVHPNPNIKSQAKEILGTNPHVYLVEPIEYPEFVFLMRNAKLAISDSGGIQEEAPSLGLPLIITRDVTERAELSLAETNYLLGSDTELIEKKCQELLNSQRDQHQGQFRSSVYGDGEASKLIVESCLKFLSI